MSSVQRRLETSRPSPRSARRDLLRTSANGAASPSDLDDLLRELLEHTTHLLDADTGVILLADGDDGRFLRHAAQGLAEALVENLSVPADEGVPRRVAETRRCVMLADLSPEDDAEGLLGTPGIASVLAVPLELDGELRGLVVVGTVDRREFRPDDAALLQLLADRAALGIAHGSGPEERQRMWMLQRSLLPASLPEIPGLALAARYVPAITVDGVGGDWYDAIPLADGRVGLAIGDVAGRGRKAAVLMGELRHAMRAYALDGDAPAVVAQRLWRFVDTLEHGEMATFLYTILDPVEQSLCFVSAAHPPPLVVGPGGGARYLDQSPGTPLGVGFPEELEETTADFPEGSTLVLYTDGLVERRGERASHGRTRVLRAVARAPRDPDALCSHLLSTVRGGRRPLDDVAVLAVQTTATPDARLHLVVRAAAQELGPVRRLLRRWLIALGADERELAALTLACQEACANAVEHAYGPGDATFEFTATHDGPRVEITVRDNGHWRAPRGDNRGRGLTIMESVLDELAIEPGADGTTIRLVHTLGRG